jgi:hypothetical protein
MAEKHTVAMFIQEDGERKQVGWASPAVDGARTFEFSPGYADKDRRPSLKNVSFEDDELSQKIAAEEEAARLGDGSEGEEFEIVVEPAETEDESSEENQTAPETTDTTDDYPQAGDEGKDSAPLTVEPNEELAAEPVENVGEETVELDNGGEIVDVADEVDEDTAPADADEDEAATVRANQQRRQNNQNRNRNNRGGNRNQGNN